MSADLMQHLNSGQLVLMDGALGTELERRGLPIEEKGWSALAVGEFGGIVQQVHEDYLRAGARLHIANSFALARHVLDPLGLGDQFADLNQRSVELFDQAVSATGVDRQSVWLAGSLSTFSAGSDRSNLPAGEILICNCRDQAEILVAAGVDLFALEMLFDVDTTLAMLEAVSAFDLPVILGFTCDSQITGESVTPMTRDLDGIHRSLDSILQEVLDVIETDKLIVSIMHSEMDVTEKALETVRNYWDGMVAVYPNSGSFDNLRMDFSSVCSTSEFTASANGWVESGVNIVGGCCGIGPEHIARLATEVVAK